MTELVRIEGLRELREAFVRKVPQHMQGSTLQRALAAGARPIIDTAKSLAPSLKGVLKRAIFSFRDKGSTPTYEARNIRPREGKRFQKSGRDAFYWRWIEFGRGALEAEPGKAFKIPVPLGAKLNIFRPRVAAVPPRPFLRPAFIARSRDALRIITERLRVELENAAVRARWRTSADKGRVAASRGISELGSLLERI